MNERLLAGDAERAAVQPQIHESPLRLEDISKGEDLRAFTPWGIIEFGWASIKRPIHAMLLAEKDCRWVVPTGEPRRTQFDGFAPHRQLTEPELQRFLALLRAEENIGPLFVQRENGDLEDEDGIRYPAGCSKSQWFAIRRQHRRSTEPQ